MGTVVDKIRYIGGTKSAIREAIAQKGVEVGDEVPFREYADKIKAIEGGGAPSFEAHNGLGYVPAAGEKVYVQPVNQESGFYSRFDMGTISTSYHPRHLLNTVAIRGLYPSRSVYSFDKENGAEIVYSVADRDGTLRYLSNYRCFVQASGNSSPMHILKENEFVTLNYSDRYAGIISDRYLFDSSSSVQKIYKFENDNVGEEVAAFPKASVYGLYVVGLHDSEVFFMLNSNMCIPYQINLTEKTCAAINDGTELTDFAKMEGITLDNKYLLHSGNTGGHIYKINDDYSLSVYSDLVLDGEISFNPYNGILITTHKSDNKLPPSMYQYKDGRWTQLQFDVSGTEQPEFHSSVATVNADASFLLSKSNSAAWLYTLAKTDGGFKAVACVKSNFTTEGFTAFTESGDDELLSLTTTPPGM